MVLKILLFLTLVLVILFPQEVLAFGPGAHIELGLKLIELGPSCFRGLTGSLGLAFIYGNLAPDFFIAPARFKRLYHSFEAFEKLLLEAKSPDEIAFSLGYGTHLLADDVAHLHLIPALERRLDLPGRLIHYYFEWTLERNRGKNFFLLRGIYLWPGHRRLNQFMASSFGISTRIILSRKLLTLSTMRLAKIKRFIPPNNLVILFERKFQTALPRCLENMNQILFVEEADDACRRLRCA
ncbi:hypothetical protein Thein_1035 [Thermodesulfatator indicus DSM 15286]|uniref:Phospholipase C/D domain-containing protein n=1 Tax=Thermodesulfatator indicus (strain DSM 15286 / JCM 11887 / CIR29812) TaxID=667014 RepID=F8ADM3_THEID|nr:zinc dependent phospholipase C family protein [Thermodesulfatator indicus]AEH44906.1 hypothetical protein Thein_1035 [Thermodesulfatator indicus DSM 15286]